MIVTWLGHSCFLLKSKDGLTVLIDPFQESEVGYALPHLEADIVIISHDHDDHNNVEAAGEKADVIFGPGEYISMERELLGVKSYVIAGSPALLCLREACDHSGRSIR